MTDFNTYSNTLPDPNNPIGNAGQSGANQTTAGLGYSSVALTSEHKILNSRTNSGRLVSRELSAHQWKISIGYNPMVRDDFERINAFLVQKRGSMTPFFVSLPQYKAPQDTAFASFVTSNTFTNSATGAAGTTNLLISHSSYSSSNGVVKPGDIFTITDDTNSNHKKAYQVTRVEKTNEQLSGTSAIASTALLIHFNPPLQRAVAANKNINFNNPLFRVTMKGDTTEYELNTNNLYSFSLKLEEAQA